MNFQPTQDQQLFARTVRELLEKECPPEAARAGFSMDRWEKLREMGVVDMLAQGMNEVDLVGILEEAGRVALPEPLIEAAMIAAGVIEGVVTAAVGTKYAANADVADVIVIERGGALLSVAREAVTLQRADTIDAARPLFLITGGHERGTVLEADTGLADLRATLGASAELLGLAARCIEMAGDYAKERHQFGKPIGSFQAVKHKLADALLHLEFARPVVYRAAWSLANNEETKARDVSMAKAMAGEAASGAARAALQTLGAIGYTQEHDLHIWMKRIWALNAAWGNPDEHRARVASTVIG
ncbi:MAG TPA: acyl-CoA dehydrogenase family protein [Actinomycetota bacterium]|nr:acyl-CoA dehydrogenase family protein [Actinomycetota bacterium]